jgi:hypothetical protein
MPLGAIIGGGLSLLGSSMAADSAADAAKKSADAQERAARLAAEEARFRPIGMTTRFGSSQFTMDPKTGRLSAAGYTVSPELQAYQTRLQNLATQGLGQAEAAQGMYQPLTGAASSLFNLGGQYLAQSPEEVAAKYMQGQQDLLAPSRERQYAQLQNQLFNTGRGGLAVGATGTRPGGGAGLGAANPEMEAYYNALAQQDAALAANAQAEGQRQLAFGTGLFGTGAGLLGQYQAGQVSALNPFTSYLGGVGTLEELGQQPFNLGVNLGGRVASPSGAQALLQGGQNAALTMQQANAANPLAAFIQSAGRSVMPSGGFSNVASSIGGLFGGGSPTGSYDLSSVQPSRAYAPSPMTSPDMYRRSAFDYYPGGDYAGAI